MFSHTVLNDGQWSIGFVLDSNDLTSTDDYQQRVLKRLTEGRRGWIEEYYRQLQKTQQALKDIEQLQQQLQVSQKQLQESQQQSEQHLQKC